MSLGKSAVRGTAWVLGSNYITFAFNFFIQIVLARILFPEDFGKFALALSMSSLLFILAGWSFSLALIQIQDAKLLKNTVYTLALMLGGGLLVISGGAAFIISHLKGPDLALMFFLISISHIFKQQGEVYRAVLAKNLRFKPMSIVKPFSSLVSMLLALFLAIEGFGAWSLVGKELLFGLILFSGYRLASGWRYSWQWNRETARRVFSFGYRMFWSHGLEKIINQGDKFLLGTLGGVASVGFYERAQYLTNVSRSIVTPALPYVALPIYSAAQSNKKKLNKAFYQSSFILTRSMLLVTVVIALFPEEIITFLLGDKWAESARVLRWLAFIIFLGPVYGNAKHLLYGIGKLDEVVKVLLVMVAITVPAISIGIFLRGVEGAAIGLTSGFIIGSGLMLWRLNRYIDVFYKKIFLHPFIAVVSAIILHATLKVFVTNALILVVFLCLVYISVLYLLEKNELKKQIGFIIGKMRYS